MKLLILYDVSHQAVLMRSLCKHVNEAGISADLIDVSSLDFYSPSGRKAPRLLRLYQTLSENTPLRHFHRDRILLWVLGRMAEHYDALDFQGLYSPLFYALVKRLKRNTTKVMKAQFWGSDLNLSQDYDLRWKREMLSNMRFIQVATPEMKERVAEKFPEYSDITVVCPFGNQHLDDLRQLMANPSLQDRSFTKMNLQGKIVVCCGYNGKRFQQHLEMIQALKALPEDVQRRLAVVFPMTYELNDDYLNDVMRELDEVKFDYDIIIDRMTERQVLTLRMLTDLVVNIQVMDALAASLQEHIFCGGVLVAGDWLPYSLFTANGIYYIKTSMEDLSDKLRFAIEHLNELKDKCATNGKKLYELTSWKTVIPSWTVVYGLLEKKNHHRS